MHVREMYNARTSIRQRTYMHRALHIRAFSPIHKFNLAQEIFGNNYG